MSTRSLGRLRDDSGAALVEFALVVPLLLALVMGIVEFGRAWNVHQVITDAAREGARRAVIRDGEPKAVRDDGTAGTVPAVILDRLRGVGLDTEGSWNAASNYVDDCAGWTPPTPRIDGPTIAGCGWGRQTGDQARVVVTAPHPFFFLGPVLTLIGGNLGPTMLSTNFAMRNE